MYRLLEDPYVYRRPVPSGFTLLTQQTGRLSAAGKSML
jgi:hypothetical protein